MNWVYSSIDDDDDIPMRRSQSVPVLFGTDPIYYVYVYLDPRRKGMFEYNDLHFDYEPFYVGKGKGNRMYEHLKPYNQYARYNKQNTIKNNLIKKLIQLGYTLSDFIVIIKNNLTENDAFNYEQEIITKIGRICDNKGPLTNLTLGGEGGDTFSRNPNKEETRKKLSLSNTGHSVTPETKEKLKLAFTGREIKWKEKISATLTGRIIPREIIQRIKYRKGESNSSFISVSLAVETEIVYNYSVEGYTVKALKDKYNLSLYKIKTILNKYGIEVRRYTKNKPIKILISDAVEHEIITHYSMNMPIKEICLSLNLSRYLIVRTLKNANIEIRKERNK